MQMRAISQLFDETALVVPCGVPADPAGQIALEGRGLSVVPLEVPTGQDLARKLRLPAWMARNLPVILREIRRADAVHVPIPGDVGTFGLLTALATRKPLFVRYCGNWLAPRTTAEHSWRRLLEAVAGGRNVVLATGGSAEDPSARNAAIQWIFSTSLSECELQRRTEAKTLAAGEPIRLVIVCRQEPAKGTGLLIQALPLILERYPDVRLDVVGNGSGLPEFRALSRDHGVDGRVTFHGKLDHEQVMHELGRAHLFCYPTASEGFPKAVLEALAAGLPVVTTPVSVLPELIGPGCGRLLPDRSPQAIAEQILGVLGDPAAYAAMSRRALEVARQYSLEAWRDRIGGLLTNAWGRELCRGN
jgi:hypothetical protein